MMTPAEFNALPAAMRVSLVMSELSKERKKRTAEEVKRRGPGRPRYPHPNDEIARRANVSQHLTQQIRRILRDGPKSLINDMLAGRIKPADAERAQKTRTAGKATKLLNREGENAFLTRLRSILNARAEECELLSKRAWCPENISKAALAEGLLDALREINGRLELIQIEQTNHPANPPRIKRREDAANQNPMNGFTESSDKNGCNANRIELRTAYPAVSDVPE